MRARPQVYGEISQRRARRDVMGITGGWDQRVTRRTLLRTGGSFAAAATLAGTLGPKAFARPPFSKDPFALGVASGDPHAERRRHLDAARARATGGRRRHAVGVLRRALRARHRRGVLPRDPPWRRRGRGGRGAQRPRRARRPRARARVLLPLQVRARRQPDRPHAHRPGPRRRGRLAAVRVRVVPALRRRLLHRLRPRGDRREPRPRHPPRRLHLRGHQRRIFRQHEPRLEIRSLDEYRLRYAQYKTDPTCRPRTRRIPGS